MHSESMFLKQGKAWVGALFLSFFFFSSLRRFDRSQQPLSNSLSLRCRIALAMSSRTERARLAPLVHPSVCRHCPDGRRLGASRVSGPVGLPLSCFLFRAVLVLDPLHFHTDLGISLSIPAPKHPAGVLVGVALNLESVWGKLSLGRH